MNVHFTLKRFFYLSSALLSVAVLGLIGALIVSSVNLSDAAREMAGSVRLLDTVRNLEVDLTRFRRQPLLVGLRSLKDRQHQSEIYKSLIEASLAEILKDSVDPDEHNVIEEVRIAITRYVEDMHRLRTRGIHGQQLDLATDKKFDVAEASIRHLSDFNVRQSRLLQAAVAEQDRFDRRLAGFTILVIFLSLSAFLLAARRFVYQPLSKLRERVQNFDLRATDLSLVVTGAEEISTIATAFQHLQQRLNQQRDQQLTFISAIAHDLKNPLGAIQMSIELLTEDKELDQNDRHLTLEIIGRQTSHLTRLVSDLLDRTAIESGKFELKRERLDLRRLLEDAAGLYASVSPHHTVILKQSERPLMVYCDSLRISQVLNNFITNAIKYSPNGGEVVIESRYGDENVSLAISDHGLGIDKDDLEKIFEPFQRSQVVRETIPGVGLGLSVSKKIIEAHHGSISVESQRHLGTTFFISLPREKAKFEGLIKLEKVAPQDSPSQINQ